MAKFDSKFERAMYSGQLKGCGLKPPPVSYAVEHKYYPDFIYRRVLIELKGRMRTSAEAAKYIWVRKHLPKGYSLVFVFMSEKTPMPNSRRRKKCGTRMTHGEWARKHDFVYYTPRTCPKQWSKR